MKCKKCNNEMNEKHAYCPFCGKLSDLVKQNSKGKIFIRMDKIIPTGILMILLGILLLVLLIAIDKIMFFGLPFAICLIGILLVSKNNSAIEFGRKNAKSEDGVDLEKCKYCFSDIVSGGRYCGLCGSKHKKL